MTAYLGRYLPTYLLHFPCPFIPVKSASSTSLRNLHLEEKRPRIPSLGLEPWMVSQ